MNRLMFLAGLSALALAATSMASEPNLHIDVARSVECRDVTPAEFAQTHPNEKIVEAKFRLSLLPIDGKEYDLEEMSIALRSPERRLLVVDYSPKTELASEIAATVTVVETTENSRSLDAGLGGSLAGNYGAAHAQALPTAGAHASQRRTVQETYQKLPPQFPVIVSGTTDGHHGVFFKIKRWTQRSLQGETEVTCRFAVPRAWRGDWLLLSCQVRGPDKWYTSPEAEELANISVLVGLFLEGDEASAKAARLLADLQQSRRGAAAATVRSAAEPSAGETKQESASHRQGGLAEISAASRRLLALMHSSKRRPPVSTRRDALLAARQALAAMAGP